jgi:hypothetical protein
MGSHYEINVSKCENPGTKIGTPRYKHFFATAPPRSICIGYNIDTSDDNLTVDKS